MLKKFLLEDKVQKTFESNGLSIFDPYTLVVFLYFDFLKWVFTRIETAPPPILVYFSFKGNKIAIFIFYKLKTFKKLAVVFFPISEISIFFNSDNFFATKTTF